MGDWIDRAKQRVLVNERQAARIFGVSLAWLKRSAENGTIPHVMVGRSRMYPWEKCRDILNGHPPMPAPVRELVELCETILRDEYVSVGKCQYSTFDKYIAAVKAHYGEKP